MFQTITDKLDSVTGGAAASDLLARGQTMGQYMNCVKQAEGNLATANTAAQTKAQTAPAAGVTDLLGAGKTFQSDLAACATSFPIK